MRRFTVLALGVISFSSLVHAGPIFIDFGDTAQQTPAVENYNHILVNDVEPGTPGYQGLLNIANLVDNTGAPTGIGIAASGFFQGSNTNGTTTPAGAAAIFHPQATRDNAFGHAAAFGTNPLTPEATVLLTGLEPATAYDFTFFGSRTGVTDNRETEFRLLGAPNNTGVLLNTANNTSTVADMLGVFPTAAGQITLLVDPGPNNNNASLFYYLGAMRIAAVPEPAFGSVVALTLIGLASRRRK